MRPCIHIYVDFDGTISLADTTDLLLQQFAGPEWQEIEAAWERGEIGSQECMIRQISLLRIGPDELDRWLGTIPLDPFFPAFVEACSQHGLPVTILSDGLDRTINVALARLGLTLPVAANSLERGEGGSWRLLFPYSQSTCQTLAGHCKCFSLAQHHGLRVLIGDGRSDFCSAEQADMVFAKDRLLAYCRSKAIPHRAFATFRDLLPTFMDWYADLGAVPSPLRPSLHRDGKDLSNAN